MQCNYCFVRHPGYRHIEQLTLALDKPVIVPRVLSFIIHYCHRVFNNLNDPTFLGLTLYQPQLSVISKPEYPSAGAYNYVVFHSFTGRGILRLITSGMRSLSAGQVV